MATTLGPAPRLWLGVAEYGMIVYGLTHETEIQEKRDTGKDGLICLHSGPAGWVGKALAWCSTYFTASHIGVGLRKRDIGGRRVGRVSIQKDWPTNSKTRDFTELRRERPAMLIDDKTTKANRTRRCIMQSSLTHTHTQHLLLGLKNVWFAWA